MDGEIKVTAATIRNLVNDIMMSQNLTPVPADALSRSMTCGLLLSNGMQDDQTFQLTLNCKCLHKHIRVLVKFLVTVLITYFFPLIPLFWKR